MTVKERLDHRAINMRRDASFTREFETTLAAISEMNDAASIVPLLALLEDEHPFEELLFSIVHEIERHPDGTYVRELLTGTPELVRESPRWSRILYMRVLNAPSTRAVFTAIFRVRRPRSRTR
jgi:hypothetical protein